MSRLVARLAAVAVVVVVVLQSLLPVAFAAGGGIRMVAYGLTFSQYLAGGPVVVPLYMSDPQKDILSPNNFYVVDSAGNPVYAWLFSIDPYAVGFAYIPSAPPQTSLFAYYGGTNPYPDYTSYSLFAVYDDFDVLNTSIWSVTGDVYATSSRLRMVANGTPVDDKAVLQYSYIPPVGLAALFYTPEYRKIIQPNITQTVTVSYAPLACWTGVAAPGDLFFYSDNLVYLTGKLANVTVQGSWSSISFRDLTPYTDTPVLVAATDRANLYANKTNTITAVFSKTKPPYKALKATPVTVPASVGEENVYVKIMLDSSWAGWGAGANRETLLAADMLSRLYPVWIEEWDTAAKTARIIVRIPRVDQYNKVIYLAWGDTTDTVLTTLASEYHDPTALFNAYANLTTTQPAPSQTTLNFTQHFPPGTYTVIYNKQDTWETITTTAILNPQTTLAPHLKDWYFDGVDDTIVLIGTKDVPPNGTTSLTMFSRVKPLGPNINNLPLEVMRKNEWNGDINGDGKNDPSVLDIRFSYTTKSAQTEMYSMGWSPNNNLAVYNTDIGVDMFAGEWWWFSAWFSTSEVGIALNAYVKTKEPGFTQWFTNAVNHPNWYIGSTSGTSEFFYGLISFVGLAKIGENMNYITKLVATSLYFLVDPSFYNGTHYFDLVSGIVGTPYGGVQRVDAEEKWLWVVGGVGVVDGVVLSWFEPGFVYVVPAGSRVVDGEVVKGVVTGVVLRSVGFDVTVEYTGTGPVPAPVLVWLNGTEVFDYCWPSGGNLYVVDSSGSPLGYWLAGYDPLERRGLLIINATLSNGLNTFTLWCSLDGNPYPQLNNPAYAGTVLQENTETTLAPGTYLPVYTTQDNKTALTAPPTQNYILLEATLNYATGNTTILAPHLWDMYIKGNTTTSTYTIITKLIDVPDSTNYTWAVRFKQINRTDYQYGIYLLFEATSGYVSPAVFMYDNPPWSPSLLDRYTAGVFNGTIYRWAQPVPVEGYYTPTFDWHDITGTWDGYTLCAYVDDFSPSCRTWGIDGDDAFYDPYFVNLTITHVTFRIRAIIRGYLSYGYALYDSVQPQHSTVLSNVAVLFDPTFRNSTHIIEPITNTAMKVYYYPDYFEYVPAEKTWLWVVYNGSGDGLVHLRFFPYGTIVEFYDSNGNLVQKVTIDGAPNDAGLVEDYTVSLPAGTYTVKAYIPKKITLAPHLYDWQFDGEDDRVYVDLPDEWFGNYTAASAIVGANVMFKNTDAWYKVIYQFPTLNRYELHIYVERFYWWLGVTTTQWGNAYSFVQVGRDSALDYADNVGIWSETGYSIYVNGSKWHKIVVQNGDILSDVDMDVSVTDYPTITYFGGAYMYLTIPHSYSGIFGRIGYVLLYYDTYLTSQEIVDVITRRVIPIRGYGYQIFLDPTFYNGTYYIDLVSGLLGTPYGGVGRVPAEEAWLWVVDGWASGGGGFVFEWGWNGTLVLVPYELYEAGLVGVAVSGALSFVGSGGVGDVSVGLPGEGWVVLGGPLVARSMYAPGSFLVAASQGVVYEAYTNTTLATPQTIPAPEPETLHAQSARATQTLTLYAYPVNTTATIDGQDINITGLETTITWTATKTTTICLKTNTILAPHLYDWQLGIGVSQYVEWNYDVELFWANVSYALDTIIKPIDYVGVNYPSFIVLDQPNVILNLMLYHSSTGSIWAKVPGRIMGVGLKWGATSRLLLLYNHTSDTNIYFESYINGSLNQRWPATGYNNGPTRLRIGSTNNVPEFTIGYVSIYANTIPSIPSEKYGYVLDQKHLILLVDPTFFNGTHYFDLVSGVVGVPYGNVSRVPAEEKWLWTVLGAPGRGRLVLKWFPVPSVIALYNGSELVAVVELTNTSVTLYDVYLHPLYVGNVSVLNVSGGLVAVSAYVPLGEGEYTAEVYLGVRLNEVPLETRGVRLPLGTIVRLGFHAGPGYDAYLEVNPYGSKLVVEVGATAVAELNVTADFPAVVVIGLDMPKADTVSLVFWQPPMTQPVYLEVTLNSTDAQYFRSTNPYVELVAPGGQILYVDVERVAVFLSNFMTDWALGRSSIVAGPDNPAGSRIVYITLREPGTYVKLDTTTGSITTGVDKQYTAPLTLVGFKGFTLSISTGATTIEGVLVTDDVYPVNLPYGVTLMILADIGTKSMSIVTMTPIEGPQVIKARNISSRLVLPAGLTRTTDVWSLANMSDGMLATVSLSAVAAITVFFILTYGMTLAPIALATSSGIMATVFALMGRFTIMGIMLVFTVVGVSWWAIRRIS